MKTAPRLLVVLFLVWVVVGQTPWAWAQEAQEDESAGRRVLIGFKSDGGLQAAADRADMVWLAGGIVYAAFDLIPAVSAWVPEEALATLKDQPDIAYVEDDVILYALGQPVPWGVDRIDADLVWPGGNTGVGVDVAIVDTGIDGNHPDLAVVGGVGYAGAPSKDGSTNPADWKDGHGHGTHCAGIVVALNNDIGVVGVAPGARLHAVKVLNDSGFGNTSDIIQGLEWCAANHMHVASMSLGGGGTTSLKNACEAAFAAGVVLVAAAGNYSGPVSAPASYSSVIAVSATDSQDKLASFSNFGPEIALAAPGVRVYSTYKNGSYAYLSGTSMACPHVTGVAALVWAAGAASNTAVRETLTSTGEDLGPAGKDNSFGYGLVDAEKAANTPTVQITSPAKGAKVSGILPIQATARGTNAITGVEFFIDGASIGTDADGADGWSKAWDTTSVANGAHEVAVVAADALGQKARQSISVVVDNLPPAPTTMHVAAIDMWPTKASRGYLVYIKVGVVDDSSPTPQTVPGATVRVTTTLPNGESVSQGAVTDSKGAATMSIRWSGVGGTFTSTVTDVTDALTYNPSANLETTESCSVP